MNSQALPFIREEFLAMFAAYNQAVWPLHIVAYGLAVLAVILAIKPFLRRSDRLIAAILAAFWLWIGGVFFLSYQRVLDHSPISTIATVGFLIQGVLFLWFGVVRHALTFKAGLDVSGVAGGALIAYAALMYPLFSYLGGHIFPASPGFGLGTVPCPTTIFTFGLLLWTSTRVPKWVLVLPTLWAVMGGLSAPVNYGIYEDVGLLVAGVLGTGLLVWRDSHAGRPVTLQPHFA
jgi:Family of unknown function (DUF6064)